VKVEVCGCRESQSARGRYPDSEIASHESTKPDETIRHVSALVRFVSFVPYWRPCRCPGRDGSLDSRGIHFYLHY